MRIRAFIISSVIVLLFASCHNATKNNSSDTPSTTVSVRYAKGFTIEHFATFTKIDVRNPWDTTKVLDTYILIDRNKPKPENLPQGKIVKIPIEKVAICTAVHSGIWKQLGEVSKIKAVCEPNYIDIKEVQDGIKARSIVDLGMSTAIDLEKLIAVSPDALIVSPFENTSYGRLEKTGTPVVQDASYMENSPLGRAEWIKFEAAFTGKDSLAEQIFTKIESKYNALVNIAAKAKTKPTVFTEMKYGQVWYVPGGKSYMAEFLKDAGANYLWKELPQSGSVPLSFESVYEKAENADFWLIKYNNATSDLTYNDLRNDYELYENFKAFRQKRIYTINTAKVRYYDEGPMQPDVILEDLVSIFHPELLRNHTSTYYFPMK
ncbi:MAG: ABC transporter substrate-binding protein [Bacteroidales bacterium]|nr:ABC transporter substrate-binding protein [Bacteroidales bacterium]